MYDYITKVCGWPHNQFMCTCSDDKGVRTPTPPAATHTPSHLAPAHPPTHPPTPLTPGPYPPTDPRLRSPTQELPELLAAHFPALDTANMSLTGHSMVRARQGPG